MQSISDGILLGLLLSVAAGPIFFALLQLGVERGFRAGMSLSIGVLLSDCFYITLVYLGVEKLANQPNFELYMGWVGGLILIGFGAGMLLAKYKEPDKIEITAKNYISYFFQGIAINIFNPFVLFLWIGVTGHMVERGMSLDERLIFFASIIITVGLSDVLKLLAAKMIRKRMKPKHFLWVRRAAGIGLLFFGLALIYRVTF